MPCAIRNGQDVLRGVHREHYVRMDWPCDVAFDRLGFAVGERGAGLKRLMVKGAPQIVDEVPDADSTLQSGDVL